MKKRIGIVAGTRPEVIKMAMLYLEMKKSEKLEPFFISTAQHRQMLDSALNIFGITPDYDMDIMQNGQTLSDLTARLLLAWQEFYLKNKLDFVLVQGDTTTVLASSIAAFYHKTPIGHVEAGLRTGNMMSPYPEEMNRKLTTSLAALNFCPTELSRNNLLKEGVSDDSIYVVGNTVIDALMHISESISSKNFPLGNFIEKNGIPKNFAKKFIKKPDSKFILVTGHRRENFGSGFENICIAINSLLEKYPDIGVLYPVHLNPNVQEPVNRILGNNDRIALIPPMEYRDFIYAMKRCYFVLSDSGGVQEEAPSLGKPVLVMRDTTERPEGVKAGTCELVGTNPKNILDAVERLMDTNEYNKRSILKNPYGDGYSSKKIISILEGNHNFIKHTTKKNNNLLNDFFDFYANPAFASRSKSEIDLKVFEMMRECGIVGDDYYKVARTLKITPTRAKNLILNSEIRSQSEENTDDAFQKAFISKIKNLGYKTDPKDNGIIIFSLPNNLLREHLKYMLRLKDKTWDSSFNSEIIRIKIEDFLDIIADSELQKKIKNKKLKDDIADFLKDNTVGLLGNIIKFILP